MLRMLLGHSNSLSRTWKMFWCFEGEGWSILDTYLYTDMCTPCDMSSLSFLIFLTFLCSAVSFRAALASSCALSWQEGHPQVRKALKIRGRAEGKREQRRTLPFLQIWIPQKSLGNILALGLHPIPWHLLLSFCHLSSDMGFYLRGVLNSFCS